MPFVFIEVTVRDAGYKERGPTLRLAPSLTFAAGVRPARSGHSLA
jgi:hypothetical protein